MLDQIRKEMSKMQNFVINIEATPIGSGFIPSGTTNLSWPLEGDLEELINIVNAAWRSSGNNFITAARQLRDSRSLDHVLRRIFLSAQCPKGKEALEIRVGMLFGTGFVLKYRDDSGITAVSPLGVKGYTKEKMEDDWL